jgi:TolB-like protein/tetratricopeptide (TPR) repeat protein
MSERPESTDGASHRPSGERLDSWKEIAAYLRRDVTTVRRWERNEGLPVHRKVHDKLGSVYAYTDELDAWWRPGQTSRASGRRRVPRRAAVVLLGGIAVALIAGLVLQQRRHGAASGSRPPIRSVAVLPLSSVSPGGGDDYFVDGLHEALIAELSRISALRVTSRTSSARFRPATNKPLKEIARDLNVDALIEGTAVREGDHVRVAIRLIDPESQHTLWSESYDRPFRDLLVIQADIARQIAGRIDAEVTFVEERSVRSAKSVNPAAYDAYLRARAQARELTRAALDDAIRGYERAIQIDRRYTDAYVGLADALDRYSRLFPADAAAAEAMRTKMRATLQAALQLDGMHPDAHRLHGWILLSDRNWRGAEQSLARAVALDPSNAEARRAYAYVLTAIGERDRGMEEIRKAVERDPLHVGLNSAAYWPFYCAGQYAHAEEQLKRALALDPNFDIAWILLGRVYTQAKRFDDAIASYQRAIQLGEKRGAPTSVARALLGHVYAVSGRQRDAAALIRYFEQQPGERDHAPVEVALLYSATGHEDAAFQLLERAHISGNWIFGLKVDPAWNQLRATPRFQDLLRRTGLLQHETTGRVPG